MGQIYLRAEDIPRNGAHDEFVATALNVIGDSLYRREGLLVVGSYGLDTWNVRSDIDLFAHTPSRIHANELRLMAAGLIARTRVAVEFDSRWIRKVKPVPAEAYYNQVRAAPRQNMRGMNLLRGVDPSDDTALGGRIVPTRPGPALWLWKKRRNTIRNALDSTGSVPVDPKNAKRALELPKKLRLTAAEFKLFGYPTDFYDIPKEDESYATLDRLDAKLTEVTRATQSEKTSASVYENHVASLVPQACELGWRLLQLVNRDLEEQIVAAKAVTPQNVDLATYAAQMQQNFAARTDNP